jgi:hypothetical protein
MMTTPQSPRLTSTRLRTVSLEHVSSCAVVIASRHGCLSKMSPVVFLTDVILHKEYRPTYESQRKKLTKSILFLLLNKHHTDLKTLRPLHLRSEALKITDYILSSSFVFNLLNQYSDLFY